MIDYIQANSLDIAKIAAIIAALVSLIGNVFNIEKKYRALLALAFSLVIVFLPLAWLNKLLTAVIIGLTASGVYSQVKPRNYLSTKEQNNNKNKDAEHEIPDEWINKV